MKFSLLLASRHRVSLLSGLLMSVYRMTSNLSEVEVLIGIDSDDRQSVSVSKANHPPHVKFFERERSRFLNRDYLNWLNQYSSGEYVIPLNDDTEFLTKNWDEIAYKKLQEYLATRPDGIVYGSLDDSIHDRIGGIPYCCFPILSRKAVEILGYVMPPEFASWGADIALVRIFLSLQRVLDVKEVKINHISHHTRQRPRDALNIEVESSVKLGHTNPHQYDISSAVNKLLLNLGNG